jgi:hypothetical protein
VTQKDLLSRLADRGESVIGRITDLPGMQQITEAGSGFRDRLDDLSRRVRGIEELEQRVAKLEQRLGALEGTAAPKRAAAKKPTPKRSAAEEPAAPKRSAEEPATPERSAAEEPAAPQHASSTRSSSTRSAKPAEPAG